jgi:hypothetical protein
MSPTPRGDSGKGLKMCGDRSAAIVLMVLSIFFGGQAIYYPIGTLRKIGPGFFPLVLSSFLFLLSIVLLVKPTDSQHYKNVWPNQWYGIGVVILALMAYGALMKILGFSVTTFAFAALLFRYGYPNRWILPLVGALLITLSVILVFRVWLGTPFPQGIFGF